MSENPRSCARVPLRQFDGFELIRPLGNGSMGSVYLARELSLERLVAIKFIAISDPDASTRLVREAKAIARLQHPNIVAIYRVGSLRGQPYIAYEFIEGRLVDVLPRPLEWPQVLHIALGIMRGLASAHRRGVIHRDIKPANIMLNAAGDVKLLDFGLAQLTEQSIDSDRPIGTESTSFDLLADRPSDVYASMGTRSTREHKGQTGKAAASNRLTRFGTLIGTPMFMAPELWQGCPATPQTDLYAVGLMLYELLEGTLPQAELGLAELMDFVTTQDLPLIANTLPKIPRPLATLVDSTDLSAQKRMLVAALKLCVDNLRYPERLVPFIEELGRRHAGYGVQPAHLGLMGRAILDTLASLDAEWNERTAQLWSQTYGHLAQLMQRAMHTPMDESTPPGVCKQPFFEIPMLPPRTEWVQSREGDVAFQRFGRGTCDIVVVGEWVTHIEKLWELPPLARLLRQLASIGQVLIFDRRGCGMSSRSQRPTLENQVDDIAAVMDAAGTERAVLLAIGDGGTAAALFAAMRPERTRGLVLYGYGRCLAPGSDSAAVRAAQVLESRLAAVRSSWGLPLFLDTLAPSLASDPLCQKWWGSYLRYAAAPTEAAALLSLGSQASARAVLGTIGVPSLVLHREGDCYRSIEDSREAAQLIPGSQHLVLPGLDHAIWAGHSDDIVGAIYRYLSSLPKTCAAETMTAGVLAIATRDDNPPAGLRTMTHSTLAHYGGLLMDAEGSAASERACSVAVQHPGQAGRPNVLDETIQLHVKADWETQLAYFDGPARVIRCAIELRQVAAKLGVGVAIAIDIGSLSVSTAIPSAETVERILTLLNHTAAGEILLTRSAYDLAAGADFSFLPQVPVMFGGNEVSVYMVPPGGMGAR